MKETENRLTILDVVYRPCPGGTRGYANVRCSCGTVKEVILDNVRRGLTRSCGCLRAAATIAANVTHGESRGGVLTAEYQVWRGMLRRCRERGHKDWPNYGGRGIKVCDHWLIYQNFLADMGRRPSARYSIDRINNDGGYEPTNCRWATRQNSNRRRRST